MLFNIVKCYLILIKYNDHNIKLHFLKLVHHQAGQTTNFIPVFIAPWNDWFIISFPFYLVLRIRAYTYTMHMCELCWPCRWDYLNLNRATNGAVKEHCSSSLRLEWTRRQFFECSWDTKKRRHTMCIRLCICVSVKKGSAREE